MQLMRNVFTLEYLISLSCVLIFLSNATCGNSSDDLRFQSEAIDYYPFILPHSQISASPEFILWKDNNRAQTKSFHARKTLGDHSMPYDNSPSGTAQHTNYFLPEAMDISKNHKDEWNGNLREMKPFYSFDVSNKQHRLEANKEPPIYQKGLVTNNPSFVDDSSTMENDLREMKEKRNGRSYQRAMKIKNGYRGFSRSRLNRDGTYKVVNPINFWKNFIRQNDDKRNEGEGMQISVTQNLDILRRRLLKEIALRQRQRKQKELMMKNKGILGNIGK